MAATKNKIQSIHILPHPHNCRHIPCYRVRVLFCLRDIVQTIFEGVHFEIQIGGPKRFPFKWKHWFLVSEMSDLSQNVYIYNSPNNMNERLCLDIATLTIYINKTIALPFLIHLS